LLSDLIKHYKDTVKNQDFISMVKALSRYDKTTKMLFPKGAAQAQAVVTATATASAV